MKTEDKPKRGRPRIYTDEERLERAKAATKHAQEKRKKKREELGLANPNKNLTMDATAAARIIELRNHATEKLGMKVTTSQMIAFLVQHWDKTHKGFKSIV